MDNVYPLGKIHYWDFPGSPVAKTWPSNAGGSGSILGWGAKLPHAARSKNQNRKQKNNIVTSIIKNFFKWSTSKIFFKKNWGYSCLQCLNSGSWSWTGRPGVLQSPRNYKELDTTEWLNWTDAYNAQSQSNHDQKTADKTKQRNILLNKSPVLFKSVEGDKEGLKLHPWPERAKCTWDLNAVSIVNWIPEQKKVVHGKASELWLRSVS